MAGMQLRLVRPMWGVLDFQKPEPHTWEPLFRRLREERFSAVEACVGPFDCFAKDQALARRLLQENGLECIRQVHTCGYPISSRKVEDHLESFRRLASEAKELGAIMVNAHSGWDGWTLAEAVTFYRRCLEIERELGLKCVHETHRRRYLFSPFTTRDLLEQVPDLKVNCDLSHWVVVGERLYTDPADAEWPQLFGKVARNTHLIHARVGYSQGPQVPDPSAPEYATELETHEGWWDQVLREAHKRGEKIFYLEPEFGPAPYLHTLPHTNVPVADLWKVNSWVGHRQLQRFSTLKF